MNSLVSIIIPTKNSAAFLENTLSSIKKQSYKKIEVIIVDGNSTDGTLQIAKKNKIRVFQYSPNVPKGVSDAPYKRNFGVKKSKGEYVYYVDADMELSKNVVKEAIVLFKKFDALIIPEDSFGEGIWAKAKNLERRCYWGDDLVEAPRFFKKKVWQSVGGLDVRLPGADDWDLYQKILKKGYRVGRTKNMVLHNEGRLRLTKLIKKRFMYGRDAFRYLRKRPTAGAKSYFPIRPAYIRNWKMLLSRPIDTILFIYMKSLEFLAGFAGIIYTILFEHEKRVLE